MTQVIEAARPAVGTRRDVHARVELAGLCLATIVVVLASGLAIAGRSARAGDVDRRIQTASVAVVSNRDAGALTRVLSTVWATDEASALATELRAWLARHPIDDVDDLRRAQVDVSRARSIAALRSIRARLADAAPSRTDGTIPLLSRADLAAVRSSLVVRRVADFQHALLVGLALIVAAFFALHALRRVTGSTADPLLLPAVYLLCGIGFAVMIDLRDPVRDTLIAATFARGVALGCALAALAWCLPIERLSFQYAPLAGALALSMLLIAFGSGPSGSEAKVNLWGVQPVEPIRILITLFLAAYFSRKWRFLRNLPRAGARHVPLLRWIPIPPLEYVVPVAVALTLVALFFVLQRDLGPALVFGCSFLALWAVAVRRAGLAIAGLGALAAGYWLVVHIGSPSIVATRVAMVADPWMNARPGGDQIAQALWGLASGAVAGSGAGLGDPQSIREGHTDLILSALGEDFGFIGLLTVALLYAVICHRAIRIALRAPSEFSSFLALGLTFGLFVQLLLIGAAVLGLMPLTGVVTPFLSYGRSAMTAHLAMVGLLLSISGRRAADERPAIAPQIAPAVRWVIACFTAIAAVTLGRAFQVQVWAADETMARSTLVRLADGTLRFDDNPRLLSAARQLLVRGTIADRNGVPLASSDRAALSKQAPALARLGVDTKSSCPPTRGRCYPFGGRMYHLLGDANTQLDWTASNNSFAEEDAGARLLGYNDFAAPVTVHIGDATVTLTRHSYRELVPLARHRYQPGDAAVQALRERPRDLRLTIDARLQVRAADLLRRGVAAAGSTRGALAVMDVHTGDVLAAVSYPWPDDGALNGSGRFDPQARLDRVRYGVYPPGSTFKLVTAAAALTLRPELASSQFMCMRLPDGRIGARLPGSSRPVRDDALDQNPHGHIGLDEAIRHSCNAYFAQLGQQLGADPLIDMASRFHIGVARPNTTQRLRAQLPYAAFGQGEALASPMRLLTVTAAIAGGGQLVEPRWILDSSTERSPSSVLPREAADRLARDMASAVSSGTGRSLARVKPTIAGKTGTAEVTGGRSHAWFTGFAPAFATASTGKPPATSGRVLAFVVLVENGGYGARAAAPIAGELVTVARELELF